jgi:hypothetical protein
VKAVGRGISAAPGLRSFGFRLAAGHCQDAPLPQQSLAGTSSTSSSGSTSSTGSSIQFTTAAVDPRRWQFALMQPAPGHMAALCVERGGDYLAEKQGQQEQIIRLMNFEADLFGSSQGRPLELQLLAEGLYP